MRSEFIAQQQLMGTSPVDLHASIEEAHKKASRFDDIFYVCETATGQFLVLPELSVKLRKDVIAVRYSTDDGFHFDKAA